MKDISLPVAAREDGGILGRDPPPFVPWVPFMWDSGVGAYAEDTLTGLTIGVPEKEAGFSGHHLVFWYYQFLKPEPGI